MDNENILPAFQTSTAFQVSSHYPFSIPFPPLLEHFRTILHELGNCIEIVQILCWGIMQSTIKRLRLVNSQKKREKERKGNFDQAAFSLGNGIKQIN